MIARGRDGRRQPEAIRGRTDPRTLERQGRRQSHKRSRVKATLHTRPPAKESWLKAALAAMVAA